MTEVGMREVGMTEVGRVERTTVGWTEIRMTELRRTRINHHENLTRIVRTSETMNRTSESRRHLVIFSGDFSPICGGRMGTMSIGPTLAANEIDWIMKIPLSRDKSA